MDFGSSSDSEIRHTVKWFGFFHRISIHLRILITGFIGSVWFSGIPLTVSLARTVPVGNSSADHSGNEQSSGCIPGNHNSNGLMGKGGGGSLGDSGSTS